LQLLLQQQLFLTFSVATGLFLYWQFFFFTILFVSKRIKQLKSIHDIERQSMGSYMLPVAIYLTFLVSALLNNSFLFILPILILTLVIAVVSTLAELISWKGTGNLTIPMSVLLMLMLLL
jgi:hypothetical protein